MRRYLSTTTLIVIAQAGIATAQQDGVRQDGAPVLLAAPSAEYGAYVVARNGLPVYAMLTDVDVGGDGLDPLESCQAFCLDNWPLVTAEGDLRVGQGLDPDLLGTREVAGEQAVLYGDRLLFQFYRDVPGEEPEGHEIFSFGGYWSLLTPDGQPIRTNPIDDVEELAEPNARP